MPGPSPRREEQLARPRSRKGGDQQKVTKGVMRSVVIPEPNPNWHHIAKLLWEGCLNSGQSDFYQDSDWAYAYMVCEEVSHYFSWGGKRSAQMFQAISTATTRLLLTEDDRRRVRIELQSPEAETKLASVTAIEDAKSALGLAD